MAIAKTAPKTVIQEDAIPILLKIMPRIVNSKIASSGESANEVKRVWLQLRRNKKPGRKINIIPSKRVIRN